MSLSPNQRLHLERRLKAERARALDQLLRRRRVALGRREQRDRELLILRIGWLNQAEYEFAQHELIARRGGVTEEVFNARIKGLLKAGTNYPMAILLNRYSASASEIVRMNRQQGPDVILDLLEQRAPQGFGCA